MDPTELRAASLQRLAATGVHPSSHLPLLDQPTSRQPEETIDRLFCLNAAAAVAYGFPRERAKTWLEQENLWTKLEREEEHLFDMPTSNTALFQWQVQGIYILAWALGVFESIDLWKPCPDDLVLKLPDLKSLQATGELRRALALRSVTEIAAEADLAYCLHWAVRDARLNARRTPGDLEEMELQERRRALDWLIGGEDWYSISSDT